MNIQAETNMDNQLDTLSAELGTGQAAQTYSGLGSQAGVALALNAQLAAINGYTATASTVGTTLSVAQSTLTQLGSSGNSVEQAINQQSNFASIVNGQTTTQGSPPASSTKSSLCSIPRSAAITSSRAAPTNQPSVASTNDILNGNGAQAGLTP